MNLFLWMVGLWQSLTVLAFILLMCTREYPREREPAPLYSDVIGLLTALGFALTAWLLIFGSKP